MDLAQQETFKVRLVIYNAAAVKRLTSIRLLPLQIMSVYINIPSYKTMKCTLGRQDHTVHIFIML